MGTSFHTTFLLRENRILAFLSRTLSDISLAVIFSWRKRKKPFQVSHDTCQVVCGQTQSIVEVNSLPAGFNR